MIIRFVFLFVIYIISVLVLVDFEGGEAKMIFSNISKSKNVQQY